MWPAIKPRTIDIPGSPAEKFALRFNLTFRNEVLQSVYPAYAAAHNITFQNKTPFELGVAFAKYIPPFSLNPKVRKCTLQISDLEQLANQPRRIYTVVRLWYCQ